jgi:hypothetical protein
MTGAGGPAILVVSGGSVPLPVEVRDDRLALVTTRSVDQRIPLPPGTYAITVPRPDDPDFHRVVELEPEQELTIDLPMSQAPPHETTTDGRQPLVEAAVALVEQGQLHAAVHVLTAHEGDPTPLERALLGFTALQLNDVQRAAEVAATLPTSPDLLALRAALLREDGEDDLGPASASATLVRQALDMGTPLLAAAARSLVAAIRDNQIPATPESRVLVKLVRAEQTDHVLLAAGEVPAEHRTAEPAQVAATIVPVNGRITAVGQWFLRIAFVVRARVELTMSPQLSWRFAGAALAIAGSVAAATAVVGHDRAAEDRRAAYPIETPDCDAPGNRYKEPCWGAVAEPTRAAPPPTRTTSPQPGGGKTAGPPEARPGSTTYLASIRPLEGRRLVQPARLSGVLYPRSVTFPCFPAADSSLAWDVAGSREFRTVAGIDDNASDDSASTVRIAFYDQNGRQLGSPVDVSRGHPALVVISLEHVVVLRTMCSAKGVEPVGGRTAWATLGNPLVKE